ncbi:MAG: EAL domain-containing protein, partial [Granulosicoccus sp.]|nr:EAL domain-containing protein [Granulosicoccus sp.]
MNPIVTRSRWIPATVFLGVSWLGLSLVYLDHSVRDSENRRITHEVLSAHALQLERTLSYALSATDLLEREVVSYGGNVTHLKQLASNMYRHFPGISKIQLSPDGAQAQVYPQNAGNPDQFYDPFANPYSYDPARDFPGQDKTTLHGPLFLDSGEYVYRGVNPIYLRTRQQSRYWGFAAVEIRIDDLLTLAGMPDIVEQGYYYELSSVNSKLGTMEVLSKSAGDRPETLVSVKIGDDRKKLILSLSCTRGLFSMTTALGCFLSLILALSLASLCRKLLTEPEKLRKKVASQTKDLQTLAYTDSLTHLANRKGFYDQLETLISAKQEGSSGVALLMFDLDDFKIINDTMGHPTGDELLVGIANRVSTVIPDNARLARLGGDEFTVTLSGKNIQSEAERVGQMIKSCFDNSFQTKTNQIYMSVSIGYAILSTELDTADKLLVAADQALYHAKKLEGGSISHFTRDMLDSARRKQQLSTDLREAIRNQELELLFQPICGTLQSDIKKAETLLRWNHPTLGVISPLEFIPLAEQTGLIVDIGQWVFIKAAKQVKKWREKYEMDFQISINVSPVQFNSGNIASNWTSYCKNYNLPGDALMLEITENILMQNCSNTQRQLETFRAAGIKIALDDFGTGYSSLSYLRHFNIDYIKIDRSFIKNVTIDENDKIVCNGIITIATELGLQVVGEGIETEQQHQLMKDLGCHYSQGYLFSKPVSAGVFESCFLGE